MKYLMEHRVIIGYSIPAFKRFSRENVTRFDGSTYAEVYDFELTDEIQKYLEDKIYSKLIVSLTEEPNIFYTNGNVGVRELKDYNFGLAFAELTDATAFKLRFL